MKSKIFFFVILFFMPLISVIAQEEKCGTMQNLQEMIKKDPSIKQRMDSIERFTQQWITQHSGKRQMQVITIPVVVHVIHYGEPIGVERNISDAQIQSQIDALNEDYRLLNADSLQPGHPFWIYTADCEIEFCLAQQDEFGNPTTGIERFDGGQPDWEDWDIDDNVKPLTIWDRDLYLNLWTVKFGGSNSSTFGYAEFPGGPDSTDGVVIRYDAFGYIGNVTSPTDLGRTATHEVGHWLNLRHIWGDTLCGDDFVSDTEPAEQENYGCPTFPHNAWNSCGTGADGEMYMNYMDYVDDSCMVMFTFGQSSRMNAALNGFRASLQFSQGCISPPVGIENNTFSKESFSIYPNPINSSAIVKYSLSAPEEVNLNLYNLYGQKIKNIFSGNQSAGEHTLELNADEMKLSQGIYFLELQTAQQRQYQKIIIIQ